MKSKPPGRPSKPLTESQKQTVVNLRLNKPQLPSKEGQQAITNIRLNKSITGQGYGVYSKPTKKYNLMRGSAMAGNNNKQLLKQIQ